jgi:hypothetical protein
VAVTETPKIRLSSYEEQNSDSWPSSKFQADSSRGLGGFTRAWARKPPKDSLALIQVLLAKIYESRPMSMQDLDAEIAIHRDSLALFTEEKLARD